MKVKEHHIQNLIQEGEHQMLDFKFEISDSRRIARSLAAFANTDGGRLLVGVKDNGAIAGVRSDEEIHMIQAAAEMYCQPKVEYSTEEWEINGKTVLEVIIPRDKHHKHKAPDSQGNYKIYVRVKDENLVADPILIKVWKAEKFSRPAKIAFTDTETLLLRISGAGPSQQEKSGSHSCRFHPCGYDYPRPNQPKHRFSARRRPRKRVKNR